MIFIICLNPGYRKSFYHANRHFSLYFFFHLIRTRFLWRRLNILKILAILYIVLYTYVTYVTYIRVQTLLKRCTSLLSLRMSPRHPFLQPVDSQDALPKYFWSNDDWKLLQTIDINDNCFVESSDNSCLKALTNFVWELKCSIAFTTMTFINQLANYV